MPPAARVSDLSKGEPHAHWCPACPHPVIGPIIMGSPNVLVNGLPLARVTDKGIHAVCCGPNIYEITMGSSTVFINGLAAARKGDQTMHCNTGPGKIEMGSPNVNIE
jgi:uncharacterized Zn-binding protein involved in type VI secretion